MTDPTTSQPDQTALRDRVIEALYEARRPGLGGLTEAQAVALMADAVLAVLPVPTDRAAVLGEAADELDRYVGLQSSDAAPDVEGARLVIRELRRIADRLEMATQVPFPLAALLATPCAVCDHTLNWHRHHVGCIVDACGCGRFEEQPAAELRRMVDETQPETETPTVTVHACPGPDDNGISPCCKRPPFEFRNERITRDPDKVTCPGPAAGAQQDGATP
jgi:hypothetical protein